MCVILDEIIKNADPVYKDFQGKLLPTVQSELILGLRAPRACAIAKKYSNTEAGNSFLKSLPHKYYDENIVHAFMLGNLKCPKDELLAKIIAFLPYMDNWAVCDGLCAHLKGLFRKDKDALYPFVLSCIDLSVYGEIPKCFLSPTSSVYTVRFGLVCLLSYYIEEKYLDSILNICVDTALLCGEKPTPADYSYYVSMAVAWLVSFCLIKEYEKSVHIIEKGLLPKWIHNKSIQKAVESYRIDKDRKNYLRSLKK